MKKKQKRKVEVLYCGAPEELDEIELYRKSFGKLSPEERLNAAWEMVELAWQLKGRNKDELRFQRTVAVLKQI